MHRAGGDRVRVFGDVNVREDEQVSGQVVAVIGSVRIDGEVGDQVVAVLGSVNLGPKAVVNGDIVSVGGRVRRAEGSQVRGAVTEVSLADADTRLHIGPWAGGIGALSLFDGFGAFPRLLASTFRFLLLVILTSLAMIIARGTVEASAHRLADDPIKATLVGIAAEILVVPVLVLTALVLAISLIGIPLLLLLPFVVLFLILLALIGFSGTAFAIGQWARRRFGLATSPGIIDVCLGVLLILLPVLVGRVIALGGWPTSPVSFLLIAAGAGLEFLAWSAGFGAVLTNAFGRWQARRRVPPAPWATGHGPRPLINTDQHRRRATDKHRQTQQAEEDKKNLSYLESGETENRARVKDAAKRMEHQRQQARRRTFGIRSTSFPTTIGLNEWLR